MSSLLSFIPYFSPEKQATESSESVTDPDPLATTPRPDSDASKCSLEITPPAIENKSVRLDKNPAISNLTFETSPDPGIQTNNTQVHRDTTVTMETNDKVDALTTLIYALRDDIKDVKSQLSSLDAIKDEINEGNDHLWSQLAKWHFTRAVPTFL